MNDYHYIGFDVHKQKIQYCIKTADGTVVDKGRLESRPGALQAFAARQSKPWKGVLEATMFSYWIYDELAGKAAELQIAHPVLVKAIQAGKHKSDKIDADKLADLIRCNWVPRCYVPPAWIRHLRRMWRWRERVTRQAVQTKNRMACRLMELGVSYQRSKLHGRQYFQSLLEGLEHVPAEVRELLRYHRATLDVFAATQRQVVRRLQNHGQLKERVERLRTIPGVGLITALTWALEVGQPERFSSIDRAVSYCGLVSGQDQSGEQNRRGPLSKQRNAHLQAVLMEAAHLAPRFNPLLKVIYDKEVAKHGSANQAAIAVARKLVAYLLAVDKSGRAFTLPATTAA